ncbi:bifunctional diguanylate cyclase/phosphodiesterase [Pseudomonas sp. PIC25]|uniref:putative bifunctional diguanylate cyclase/phosphodiesterase n=1 Tax=Pseudomonas sp. PIC25 TaxID=1958773 RepID=UPI000BABDF15|nr:EAL domain-containing protein [Pseudomonas sp. PIC25]
MSDTTPQPSPATPASSVASSSLSQRMTFLLLAMLALLLLAVWTLPTAYGLRLSDQWFPVSLHIFIESSAVAVAILVFAVTWHAYRPERPANLVVLACGFLAVGLLDFAHALSYKGMPDFVTPASPEKAIYFWLAARLIAALTLLTIAFRSWRPLVSARRRYALLCVTLVLVAALSYLQLRYPDIWPRTFIEGKGLTPLKIAIEWLIVALLVVAALRFSQARAENPPYDAGGMLAATLIAILSELCFTAYNNVNDIFALLGHLYKIIGYCFIYRVVFVSSVREPYERLSVAIAQRDAAEQRADRLAFYDGLTGLPNLTLLQDRAEQALAAAQRNHSQVALLCMDIDGFKLINDSLGHAHGDGLLRAIAERLRDCVTDADTVCRPGGDEFAILLTDLADAESAAAVPERIIQHLKAPFPLFGQSLEVSASIGVALSPHDGLDFQTLLRNAETAMYQAKRSNRQPWCFYDAAMNTEMSERLNLLNGLRRALDEDQLQLHYQLQFDLDSGAIVGAEALVRWQHPQLGLLMPGRFIAAAEESGLIIPIGDWIIHQACRQAVQWRQSGLPIPRVAVNLSAIQLHDGKVEDSVLSALAATGLPASALELELTESSLIEDTEQVQATVRRLKALGVRLSIDDFGTGFSSLSYLRHLAVDKLKIDQSFIRDLTVTADAGALVSAILNMAASLGLKTIAEGVEDRETADKLCELGCRQAQGYLFARPMSAEQLPDFIAELPTR